MTDLFALAFDHRNSMRRDFLALTGPATAEQTAWVRAAKEVVLDALVAAAPDVEDARCGLLLDIEYGGHLVRRAQQAGITVALPVEVSGRDELEFDGDFTVIAGRYAPDFVKVLVRYNPDGDGDVNARQRDKLAALASWTGAQQVPLMIELLVPPTAKQESAVGRDYDHELRPALSARAITEIAAAGVHPALWKVEGPPTRADAWIVTRAALDADPSARLLVLGRGSDDSAVAAWLTVAAGTAGFAGFAIGRTVWWAPLAAWREGSLGRLEAVEAVRENYLRTVRTFQGAAGSARAAGPATGAH